MDFDATVKFVEVEGIKPGGLDSDEVEIQTGLLQAQLQSTSTSSWELR